MKTIGEVAGGEVAEVAKDAGFHMPPPTEEPYEDEGDGSEDEDEDDGDDDDDDDVDLNVV